MPKKIITETTVYTFAELSETAKESARVWFRNTSAHDEFWDYIFTDAQAVAALFGLEIPNVKGTPAINFSGFASQGDGASFIGTYTPKPGSLAAVKEYAPKDTKLHAIVEALDVLAEGPTAVYRITRSSSNYCHENTMDFEVVNLDEGDDPEALPSQNTVDSVCESLRDFARWIYRNLERENDYRNSAEYIDESIEANEYEFTEDGKIFT